MVSGLRRLGRALLALLGLVLAVMVAVVVAWLLSQGRDAEPRPLPAALQLPPAGPPTPVFAQLQTLLTPETSAAPTHLHESPLGCGRGEDCAAVWSEKVATVAPQLARLAALGLRCEAALIAARQAGRYVEWLPERPGPSQPIPMLGHQMACQRWLIGQALVAASAGDAAAAQGRLQQSQDWALTLLGGTRTLIGHQIVYAQLNLHLQAVAAVALLQPGWAGRLADGLRPWPDEWLNPARWMPAEAAYTRGAIDEQDVQCQTGALPMAFEAALDLSTGLWRWLCRHRLGWLPEATRQAQDAVWLARIERLRDGPAAWLEDARDRRARGQEPDDDDALSFSWRNTLGAWFVDLGRRDGLLDAYIARPADLAEHRQLLAATLALRRAGVPAAERPAWLARHGGLPPGLLRRVGWESQARALRWLTWSDELRVGGTPTQPSAPFRIALEPTP